jgi:MFS family permease
MSAGTVLVMLVAGRLVDRFDSARVTRPAAVATALALVGPGFAPDLPLLAIALFGYGAAGGLLDVAMNAQAVRIERAYGRPIMSSLHALYSLGALGGAVVGGLFARGGVSAPVTFVVTAVPLAVLAVVCGRWLLPSSDQAATQGGSRLARPEEEPVTNPAAPAAAAKPARVSSGSSGVVLLLGLLAACAVLGEGSAGDWSGVYLRDDLGASAGLAAAGFAAFSITMTAGRLTGDRLAARFGPVRLVRGCGLLAAGGLVVALLSGQPIGAIAGFGLLGAGLSCIVPQVFTAVGAVDPDRAGRNLARVSGLTYLGLLGGPAAIGAVGSLVGLPWALGIPAALAVVVALSAGVLHVSARSFTRVGGRTGVT